MMEQIPEYIDEDYTTMLQTALRLIDKVQTDFTNKEKAFFRYILLLSLYQEMIQ